jgi:acyl-CoA thioester hydrolase
MRSQSEDFRFHADVDVRFSDIDVGGHAHHSRALIYMEEARAAYWQEVVGGASPSEPDYILAEASLRFVQRVLYPDRLRVAVRVSVLGSKHFRMEYEVYGSAGELLVSGSTTQVMFDYERGRSMRVPDEVRARIESLDGPFEPGR